jgi:hypothetical protein
MGMFDYINYKGNQYQSKDTPQQTMDTYEIRGDELWWKKTEYEWTESESLFGGYMKEISHEWVFCEEFDGRIVFYRSTGGDSWEEYKMLFMDGKIIKMEKVE